MFLLWLFFLLFTASIVAQEKNELTVMFYNTENFFDTIDDPHKSDNEFLPDSKAEWNSKKYFSKIKNLEKVIDSVVSGPGFPALVGLCEVENETAIGDLLSYSRLKSAGYDFKVTNSPDVRSIDVALLYDKKFFRLLSFREISATDPELPENKTRNILFATLLFNGKETLHVFVNHWPSMRDGEAESEPRRIYAARQLRHAIDSLKKKDQSAKIIVMGDFNETPGKEAIYTVLKAKEPEATPDRLLVNPFYDLAKAGHGTHHYRNEWNVLDQIMLSDGLFSALKNKKGLKYKEGSAGIFKNDLVLFTVKKTGEKIPNRTYKGSKYFNGYSDHLAVFLKLSY